ncbi:MAG: helix-turn-helix domain-containing protein [Sphingomonadaceae bacterium]|nr:helix-turn-helix domain-containing protein [Sphingomonadaceae bacterium]
MESEAIAGDGGSAEPRSVGAVLAAARQARGLDLADVARETRVPVRHLAAIEADEHAGLPALPYAIGFVKAFARVVGVDPDVAGARFRAETDKPAHVPVAPAMAPVDERRLPPRGLVVASLAALIAVIAGVVAWSAGAFDPRPTQVAATQAAVATPKPANAAPAVPVATDAAVTTPAGGTASVTAAADGTPAAGTATPTTTAAPPPAGTLAASAASAVAAPPGIAAAAPATTPAAVPATAAATTASGPVVVTARDDAWVRITVFDPAAHKIVTVKTGVLAKGERFVPPATPGLRLWTGRAGALAITVDGRAVPALGGPVETVRNVSLDPADLRARLAAAPAVGRAGPPVG